MVFRTPSFYYKSYYWKTIHLDSPIVQIWITFRLLLLSMPKVHITLMLGPDVFCIFLETELQVYLRTIL